jgi:hypothetical protein
MAVPMSRSVLAFLALGACITSVQPPPTPGYGAPYKGTGEGIYVKDDRGNWNVTEGQHPITSEQALEATGDTEYETRRQDMRAYNRQLEAEGHSHKTRGNVMVGAGVVAMIAGAIATFVVAPNVQDESITAATSTMPEMRSYTSGDNTRLASTAGVGLFILGIVAVSYGYFGGRKSPPYYEWHTPTALNRPAYVRQQTEPYNERIGAPSIPDEEGKPQFRRALPAKHADMRMRGGR